MEVIQEHSRGHSLAGVTLVSPSPERASVALPYVMCLDCKLSVPWVTRPEGAVPHELVPRGEQDAPNSVDRSASS